MAIKKGVNDQFCKCHCEAELLTSLVTDSINTPQLLSLKCRNFVFLFENESSYPILYLLIGQLLMESES